MLTCSLAGFSCSRVCSSVIRERTSKRNITSKENYQTPDLRGLDVSGIYPRLPFSPKATPNSHLETELRDRSRRIKVRRLLVNMTTLNGLSSRQTRNPQASFGNFTLSL